MDSIEISKQDIASIHEHFREAKHAVNNTLAVIMALSELAQRNPAHYEKLVSTVLMRCPDIVNQLQNFQNLLNEKIGAPAPMSLG